MQATVGMDSCSPGSLRFMIKEAVFVPILILVM